MTPGAIAAELGLREPEITPLEGGLSNHSWRLRDAHQDLVLRLPGKAAGELGADRHSELAVQKVAAAAGLAPHVVLARPAEGLLVTRYVDGRVLTRDDLRLPGTLARIGAWLAELHALAVPQDLAAVDFGARAAAYIESLQALGPTACLRELEQGLAARRAALPAPAQLTCCHHDLHHLNIVDRRGALVVLDWEYAGLGDPAADLAACVGYHDLDEAYTGALLDGYGGDSRRIIARMTPLCWIFDCLWFGWLEIAAREGVTVDAGRRQILVDRLLS
jgi:thiamine kinase